MIDSLKKMGFTMYEAKAYIALLENEEMNGYELSKVTGIPKSNAYSVLETMVEKGYAYRIDEKSVKFTAVGFEEIAEDVKNQLNKTIDYLQKNLPIKKGAVDKFITVEGSSNIVHKIITMINKAVSKIIIDVYDMDLDEILDALKGAKARNVSICLIVTGYKDRGLDFNYIYCHDGEEKIKKRDFNMVCDGEIAISAEIGNKYCKGVFSQNKNFVNVIIEALSHDIFLEEALKGCTHEHKCKVKSLEKIFF